MFPLSFRRQATSCTCLFFSVQMCFLLFCLIFYLTSFYSSSLPSSIHFRNGLIWRQLTEKLGNGVFHQRGGGGVREKRYLRTRLSNRASNSAVSSVSRRVRNPHSPPGSLLRTCGNAISARVHATGSKRWMNALSSFSLLHPFPVALVPFILLSFNLCRSFSPLPVVLLPKPF